MRATAAERRAIRQEVERADIRRLFYWLAPSPDWECWRTEREVPCPRCQRGWSAPILCAEAAVVDDLGLTWTCMKCRGRGTRFGLEWQVLNDPDAVRLVLADVLAAGVRR